MSTEENKAIYRRFMEVIVNNKQLNRVEECIAADMVEHTPGLSSGAAGLRQDFEGFFSAFPDMRVIIEDLLAEGDKVAARYSWIGTHQGVFNDIPPTGKQVTVMGLDLWRLHDGKCIEHWNQESNLGLLQQLGVIPLPGQAAT
jgi:predicted ester cyclase